MDVLHQTETHRVVVATPRDSTTCWWSDSSRDTMRNLYDNPACLWCCNTIDEQEPCLQFQSPDADEDKMRNAYCCFGCINSVLDTVDDHEPDETTGAVHRNKHNYASVFYNYNVDEPNCCLWCQGHTSSRELYKLGRTCIQVHAECWDSVSESINEAFTRAMEQRVGDILPHLL